MKKRKPGEVSPCLWDLDAGEECLIDSFQSALAESYQTRLMELGFQPGMIVNCILAPRFGAPKLYRVQNAIYSLDDQVAKCIDVTPRVAA